MDEKALEDASRAYCDVIRLNYEALPAPLAAKRDEAMRAAITVYLQALSPGSTGETEGWRDIESAPHGEDVLLGWWAQDGMGGSDWSTEIGPASHGWRRGSISNMSRHGHATHWRPLPEPPSAMLSAAGERG